MNKLYPLEVKSDTNEGRNTVNSSLDNICKSDLKIDEKVNVNLLSKQQAAVTGEIRRKFTNE